jgi:hypothetical protein
MRPFPSARRFRAAAERTPDRPRPARRSVTWISPGSHWDSIRPAAHAHHHRSSGDPDPDGEPVPSGLLGRTAASAPAQRARPR